MGDFVCSQRVVDTYLSVLLVLQVVKVVNHVRISCCFEATFVIKKHLMKNLILQVCINLMLHWQVT